MYNSTIIRKKRNLVCGHNDYPFSKGRCKQCATVQDFYNRQEKEIESDATLSELIKEADSIFSQFVRLSAANKDGIVSCYICDKKVHWKESDAAHYVPRSCMILRFEELNVRVNCRTCNQYLSGNLVEYGKRLELERQGLTEQLYEDRTIVYKHSRQELIDIINGYTKKVIDLKKRLGI